MENKLNFVSVIIPVYNDSDRLSICLAALENQTYTKDRYEVIVVNNNSTEDIQSVVEKFTFARIAHEFQQGSYAARNKGISLAQGQILAFTDSDCIPSPNWIEKGVEVLEKTENCGMVAGKIELFFQNQDKPTVIELYDSMSFLRQKLFIEELKFGATANLFTFKTCFDKVGLFDANLKSSGDREWGQRLFKAGYNQAYAENACVAHPARNNIKEIRKKAIRIVEGLYTLDNKKKKTLLSFIKEIFLDLKPPRKETIEILKSLKSNNFFEKIQYIYLFIILRWVKAGKKIQLYFKS
jgi:glycosyltransferase involved in cell wall biosynthesis